MFCLYCDIILVLSSVIEIQNLIIISLSFIYGTHMASKYCCKMF
jgi:hypothetical protein